MQNTVAEKNCNAAKNIKTILSSSLAPNTIWGYGRSLQWREKTLNWIEFDSKFNKIRRLRRVAGKARIFRFAQTETLVRIVKCATRKCASQVFKCIWPQIARSLHKHKHTHPAHTLRVCTLTDTPRSTVNTFVGNL